MKQIQHRSIANGFTIVETLIVLAIAGLILSIVFEALPALERNSRNNQRRQDVNSILEEVSHYELNNSGNILPCSGSGPSSCFASGGLLAHAQLTYYSSTSTVTVSTPDPDNPAGGGIVALPAYPPANPTDTVQVFNLAKCDGNTASSQGAGYNDVVAVYSIETGNGTAEQCQQL